MEALLRIKSININGPHGKEEQLKEIARSTDILRLTRTWLTEQNVRNRMLLNELVNTDTTLGHPRDYGEVVLTINAIMKYRLIGKKATRSYQYITIAIQGKQSQKSTHSPSLRRRTKTTC